MPRILCCALLLVMSPAWCGSPGLDIPHFGELRARAVESTELTIGPLILGLARWFTRDEPDNDDTQLLRGMKRVVIRHYEFASDVAVPRSQMEAIRSQLTAPRWSRLLQARDAGGEDVGIYVARDGEQISSLAIIAVEPRAFTLIHVVGKLDPAMVGRWQAEYISSHDHQ